VAAATRDPRATVATPFETQPAGLGTDEYYCRFRASVFAMATAPGHTMTAIEAGLRQRPSSLFLS